MLRKKPQLIIFLLFIFFQANSQNLVPNPSFENMPSPPCDYITYASEFNNDVSDWFMPSGGTSDLYSTLVSTNCVLSTASVNPYARGRQLPRTGNAMAGFYAYGVSMITDYREYLEVKLTSPLIIGETYYVEMYVSASELMQYGINNIGVHFSTFQIDEPFTYTTLTSYPAHVKSSAVITDTVNWVKISGTYTATTAAQYMLIGNMYDDASTTYAIKNNNWSNAGAYYFIDDITVESICNPKDSSTTICKGNSITLGSNESTIISWALASDPNVVIATTPSLVVSPQANTSYIATHVCGLTATVDVVVKDLPHYTLGNDTTICVKQKLTYDATTVNATYVWQDGSTNPKYAITQPGYYTVKITNSCGTLTEDINVTPCCTNPKIPNLITPNGDAKNEVFDIGCYGEGGYELQIYNSWGSLVYRSTSYQNNWGAHDVSDGIYYYVIKLDNESLNNGWVQVLR